MPTQQKQEAAVSSKRVLAEDLLSITQAVEIVRIETRRAAIDRSYLHRWIHYGLRGVQLEAIQVGREWITSKQALTRFIEQTRRKPQ